MTERTQRIHGLLLGGAVGDSLGLPMEGLSRGRQKKWWPGALQHRFLLARGMISDDIEHAINHTVPVALFAWLRHRGDFTASVASSIRCGGDTDTVAAIVGSLAGCEVGVDGIPVDWREGLVDWPRSPRLLGRLAVELGSPGGTPVRWFWPGVLPRNLFFLAVVLAHGFRRLLPPY
jgi:ADP-ribosylglycohydrolase